MGQYNSNYCDCDPKAPREMYYDTNLLNSEGDSLCKKCEKILICKCDEDIKKNYKDYLTTSTKCCGKCGNYILKKE